MYAEGILFVQAPYNMLNSAIIQEFPNVIILCKLSVTSGVVAGSAVGWLPSQKVGLGDK